MMKIRFRTFMMIAFVVMIGSLFSACVSSSSHPQKAMDQMKDNIVYDLPASASISKVSYFYEDYKGSPTLHFEVDIKNTTQVAHRYRLNILLPQGPAVGGMYPRKKKAIEPGETLTRKFPVYIDSKKFPSNFMPTGFTLVIKEL
jgi:archaellum component FlaF (FlaF/FlaG flagellin family)